MCFIEKCYAFFIGSSAAALTERRILRGLITDYCKGDISLEDKLTVQTVRLKPIRGSFNLGHLIYLQTDMKLIF
jgi:hypothetical protein